MYKNQIPSTISITGPRSYLVLTLLIIFALISWLFHLKFSSPQIVTLPQSTYFTYVNVSSQIHLSETQGILYVPPLDQSAHFASIKSKAVRGNHRHKGNENSISGEVIVLLQGQFQFRIGDGDTNKYEDHRFDVSQMGIIALQFAADQCHAVKNIGKETNWFASYYIKSKNVLSPPPIDKQGCSQIVLT